MEVEILKTSKTNKHNSAIVVVFYLKKKSNPHFETPTLHVQQCTDI